MFNKNSLNTKWKKPFKNMNQSKEKRFVQKLKKKQKKLRISHFTVPEYLCNLFLNPDY